MEFGVRSEAKRVWYVLVASLMWALSAQGSQLRTPENAALLYYQGLLTHSAPDYVFAREASLETKLFDDRVEQYFDGRAWRLTMMYLTEADSRPLCDWGVLPSSSLGINQVILRELSQLHRLLSVDAQILAAEGHTRQAMERCLTMLRLASRFGDCTFAEYTTSQTINLGALSRIRSIMMSTQLDTDTLVWLRGQLAIARSTPWSPAIALPRFMEMEATVTRESLEMHFPDEAARDAFPEVMGTITGDMSYEEYLDRVRAAYESYLEAVLGILDSEALYQQKTTQLEELKIRLQGPFLGNEFPRQCKDYYGMQVRIIAVRNILRAAIEVYLAAGGNGQAPDALLGGLPQDPYTGRDLQYSKTSDGFVLRFDPDGLSRLPREAREFEFRGN